MADAVVMANGSIVKKSLFQVDSIAFHKHGFVNEFILENEKYIALYFNGELDRFASYTKASAYYDAIREYDNKGKKRPVGIFSEAQLNLNVFDAHLGVKDVDRVFIQTRTIKPGPPKEACKRIQSWIILGDETFDITNILAPPTGAVFQDTENCQYITPDAVNMMDIATQRAGNTNLPQWDDEVVGDIAELLESLGDDLHTVLDDLGALPVIQAEQAIWTSDPDADLSYYYYSNEQLIAYRDYLKGYKKWFNSHRNYISVLEDSEKMYLATAAFSFKGLEVLTVDEKIGILDTMAQDSILGYYTSSNYNEEKMVLRVVRSVTAAQATAFLERLWKAGPLSGENGSLSLFELLYNKIGDELWFGLDDDNRKEFIKRLYYLWYVSLYNPINKYGVDFDIEPTDDLFAEMSSEPLVLNYNSEKSFGFNFDNMKFYFNDLKIKVKEEQVTGQIMTNTGGTIDTKSYVDIGSYAYHRPILLKDFKENEEAIKLPRIAMQIEGNDTQSAMIPLFFLKYLDDYGDSEDTWNLVGIVVDVALTFTGIGNISKLRYLRHTTKLGWLALGRPLADDVLILGLRGLAGISAGIDLTAGVASLILNYYTDGCRIYKGDDTDPSNDPDPDGVLQIIGDGNESGPIPEQPNNDDYEFCKNLDNWLFWVQMASVSTDLFTEAMVRRASKKLIDGNVPVDFHPDAVQVISSYADDVDLFWDQFKLAKKLSILGEMKPSILSRIKASDGAFAKKYFNNTFTDTELDNIVAEAIELGFDNTRFIEDVIIMACRFKKRSNPAEVLIQLNYYKKVILKNGFPSGFENINDFKLYCNKAKNYFEGTSEYAGKVDQYRVQGSVLFKKSDFNPPDPDNIPFLKKRNPAPPPEYLDVPNVPDDLDVQLLMTRQNATDVCNKAKAKWMEIQATFDIDSMEFNEISGIIKDLTKGLNKGLVKHEYLLLSSQNDLYNGYRAAIKDGGQDLFKQTKMVDGEEITEIGFAIVVKNSKYDVQPTMEFLF